MAAGLLAYADTRGETPKVSFIHSEKRGDDIAETDAAGQLSRKNTYTEYGQIRQGPPPSPYGFLGSYGRFFDPQTALYLLGARLYDPTLGRFLSRDPMPGGSANDYEYGAGNPVMNVDPSGTSVMGCALFVAGLIVGQLDIVALLECVFNWPDSTGTGGKRGSRLGSVFSTMLSIRTMRGGIEPRELGRSWLSRVPGFLGIGSGSLFSVNRWASYGADGKEGEKETILAPECPPTTGYKWGLKAFEAAPWAGLVVGGLFGPKAGLATAATLAGFGATQVGAHYLGCKAGRGG